jgi:hypothetical protein
LIFLTMPGIALRYRCTYFLGIAGIATLIPLKESIASWLIKILLGFLDFLVVYTVFFFGASSSSTFNKVPLILVNRGNISS